MSTNTNQGDAQAKRSASRPRMPSRPTTPLRSASRTSLRESQGHGDSGSRHSQFPLDALEPAFAELADSMADLEANFMHLQLMHESLARFSEDFASFLYGLNMNAFCVDFPEDDRYLLRRASTPIVCQNDTETGDTGPITNQGPIGSGHDRHLDPHDPWDW
ncbi:MAG: DASH complex subunit dam1 [Lichina confinis]|nr:MAG: DASH complex subunit dam1 [Lichina confinis]